MSILTLKNASKDFGIKAILQDGNLSLEEGEKVGLIGTNGSGKSTLMKMLAGLEPLDQGDRWVNAKYRVVYLPQDPPVEEDRTVLEQVFADCSDRLSLVRDYELLSQRLANAQPGDNVDRLMTQMADLGDRIEAEGAWDLETQAKIILSKLGIDNFSARVGDLSGGYRKRIALATALLSEPDLLLMDEPTNHLDAISVEWLQGYLNGYRGAVLLVTHDRYFLDRVTRRILELDRGDLSSFDGNYGYYLEKKAEEDAATASSKQKLKGVLRRELAWLKRGAKARSTKQKARIDRYYDMKGREFKEDLGKVEISTASRRIGKKVIEIKGVSKSYGDRPLIKDFTYTFEPQDRVGVIGGNGAGKSTLVNIMIQRLKPDEGEVSLGQTIHVGYFDQHTDDLSDKGNWRVINYLKDAAELVQTADGNTITASQMLERFLFPPEMQFSPIEKLSGGEKRRLFLLRVLMAAPNVLVLDEPTNDLDVQTLAVLEEYLEAFNGCVIIVSHDRYFLDRVVNRIFSLEPGGNVRQYPGNYSVYLDFCAKEEALEKEKQEFANNKQSNNTPKKEGQKKAKVNSQDNGRSRKLSYKEKRELAELDEKVPALEEEKERLEKSLYENPPSDYTEMEKLTSRLATLEQEIDGATERWLILSEIAESN
ncbi:MAG: ABC-F family ATP-binding cassette domain-containing protein [Cyanophyceae cyanobacterium]